MCIAPRCSPRRSARCRPPLRLGGDPRPLAWSRATVRRYRADLAWLDGVLAAVQGDTAGLVSARVEVRKTGAAWALYLDRSLGAFESALRGDRRGAAKAMAALEWELADGSPWFAHNPKTPHRLLRGVDRMAAAEWLLAEGDSTQAIRYWGGMGLFRRWTTKRRSLLWPTCCRPG